jgi:hypothetical protein
MTFVGVGNENEFYPDYYLADTLDGDSCGAVDARSAHETLGRNWPEDNDARQRALKPVALRTLTQRLRLASAIGPSPVSRTHARGAPHCLQGGHVS